ncbi:MULTISPECIES: nuclear transport factor 2 family protein [unclassified Pseudomonas]|uniref:nuclear transport factor 2 family protein n=1 Tax=unclassified Pseudomonas TaxID=196821 RepID=UPI00087140F1|nr:MULTISPECIES: nuclear transport factor 2 family protein [unclassified Pseudomonas]SCW78382.1 Ketosteroid isomerase-related protein [Pseudomonas sp. NFACC56-3]SFK39380.1 Ketosteroid isomerase-related protein [Pseudomonas sp. NFACC52]
MKNAVELLQQYLDAIQTPYLAAALFAEDGVLELPYLESLGIPHSVKGPAAIEGFIGSLLGKVPDFKFHNVRFLIDTPDQVFAEYSVEALVPATGLIYRQMYAGRLVAKDGKIQLLRESLDTVAAAKAFAPVEAA